MGSIIDRIIVCENKKDGTNKLAIKLKAVVQMLLETGALTEEELEKAGYRGKVVNFNWDIEGDLSVTVVQKVRNKVTRLLVSILFVAARLY